MKYKSRILDDEIKKHLSSTGAVVIEGPKACGKTTTARQFSASEVLLDIDENARQAIQIDPTLILGGNTPRLIDEWQLEPKIWNHIRRTIDDRGKPGQFILTGSAMPADDMTRHTGAGRLTRIQMRPMSWYESGHSTGKISLKDLLDGMTPRTEDCGLTVIDIAKRISTGGWPNQLNLEPPHAFEAVRSYLNEIRRVNIGQSDQTRRDPEKVGAFLQSLARNVATTASVKTLSTDTGGAEGSLHDDTARNYLKALTRLMIIENQPAWAPHLRSKSRLRKSPKRHFVDPSLAVAALRATPERLLKELNLLGLLFESSVICNLCVYAQGMDAKIYHYRDETELEVDAIVESANGHWGAFEIKLGSGGIESGVKNLLNFAKKVDKDQCGSPNALGVIVGRGFGHMRDDGISVIPIGELGP